MNAGAGRDPSLLVLISLLRALSSQMSRIGITLKSPHLRFLCGKAHSSDAVLFRRTEHSPEDTLIWTLSLVLHVAPLHN